MDYSKLPSQLIYRTRKSLEEFTTNNTMNEYLVDNMLDINYLQSSNFKERVTACFNAAYYICTLILVDEHPEWNLPKYYEIAYCNQKNNNVEQAISLSLVKIYLLRFGSEWHEKHKKLVEKLDGFFNTHWIQQGDSFLDDYSYHDAFNNLTSFDVITSPFTTTEFALRVIDQEAIEEMQIADFTWTQFTDYYKYNIMQDIVFHVGKTEDEMTLLVNSLRHDAENFYSKNNPYYESVCNRLDEIKRDIYFHFHAAENEALMQAEIEELQYQGDVRPLQARIAELEREVADLKNQLSDCATNDDVAEILKDDEQTKVIQEQKSEIERLKTLNEVIDKQLKRYQSEEASTEDLDEKKKLEIDERIIFVSALLGVSLKPDVVNQTQLAKLIAKLTGDTWQSIRPRISSINSETQQVIDKTIKQFSEGTQSAAKNVYDLINKAVKGATRENKGYQCKQSMENINQTYQLGIKM